MKRIVPNPEKHEFQAKLPNSTTQNTMKTRSQTHILPLAGPTAHRQSKTLNAALFITIAALSTLQPHLARSQILDAFDPEANNSVWALAVQTDGKVLVAGNFTVLAQQPVSYIGRLNPDGTLDASFYPQANKAVYSLAIQPDGKILAGGPFTALAGQTRNYIGRLNADGTLDTFNPGANNSLYNLAIQPDGKILAGGPFTALAGQTRNYIGRLNSNGTLDTTFNPGANNSVYNLAIQPDGKILAGGVFTALAGQTRNYIGRLNSNGTLDSTFNPGANNIVNTLALQPDGKILVGGQFTGLGGQTRYYIGRLNSNGTLDTTFNPGADNNVVTLTLQADGKILVGGQFTHLGGRACLYIGRLNADGTLDATFNSGANGEVDSFAVQPDRKILVGGNFAALGSLPRNYIGRLNNTGPATQFLRFDNSTITWLRGGSSPEVWQTTFEFSPDGIVWSGLGHGTYLAGGWQLTNVSLPYTYTNGTIRARGYVRVTGPGASSSWFTESDFQLGTPMLYVKKAVYVESPYLTVGTNYQLQVSTDLSTWTHYGPAFTATNSTWRSTNYWDVDEWNKLFFRLQFAP
jgi:uncharacterized delta-60 repeat protein